MKNKMSILVITLASIALTIIIGIGILSKVTELTEFKKAIIYGGYEREFKYTILDKRGKEYLEAKESNTGLKAAYTVLDSSTLDVENTYSFIPVVSAGASSTITQEGTQNDATVMFDGSDETSWQEGVEGLGIGEQIEFYLDGTYNVKYIGFKLGNWRDEEHYMGNASPSNMTIYAGDEQKQVAFGAEWTTQWVEIPGGVTTSSFIMTIDNVYPGRQWEDTCITEIMVYGDPL